MTVDEAIAELSSAKGNYKCSQMVRLLESLGFVVEDAKTKHHKKVKHPKLPGFYGTNFACPSRGGAGIKTPYITNIRRTLETWKDELERVL